MRINNKTTKVTKVQKPKTLFGSFAPRYQPMIPVIDDTM